ncbi:hypothetical protein [Sneathiella limimaris]|uniref:hypothetical protein n=1 Tax=Sneathiella limimaris TaxID=1964213 RepID=UPI00146CBED7|nr:hypothetical protein [Sneathiella limimaris]
MSFSPELWASVLNAAVFISLILIPWAVGAARKLTLILGVGGLIALLAFNFATGHSVDDYTLSADLMILTAVKAIFFFVCSLIIERIFRAYMIRRELQKPAESTLDPESKADFDRQMKGMKERSGKIFDS